MKSPAILLAILCGAAPLRAQSATFVSTPYAPFAGTLVHDPDRSVVVVFGPEGRIWEWNGSSFRARLGVAHNGPAAGAYDPLRREILTLNGGAWNGASWRSMLIPNGWSLGAMAFDVARQRLVCTCSVTGTAPGVAEWDGQQWARITPPASPGIGGSLAYDPTRACCVLAIGNPVSLWTWDGSQWSLLDGNGPAATAAFGTYGVWFDPNGNRLVVHGGSWNPAVTGTWARDANGWTTIATPMSFSGSDLSLAWDGTGLLRLSAISPLPEGVWRLEGNTWRRLPIEYPPLRNLISYASPAFASSPTRPGVVLFGGSASYTTRFDDTWILDGVWMRQTPLHSPSPRGNAGLAWSPANQAFVLFGGVDAQNTTLLDTWIWDGTDWTQQAPATPPTVPVHLVTDPSGGVLGLRRTVAGPANDQWLWNGTSWVNQPSYSTVSFGQPVAAAFDPRRNMVVVAVDTQHWEWNGVAWTQIGLTPDPNAGWGRAVYRPDTQRVLFHGSQPLEWDGTTWTNVNLGPYLPYPLTLAPDYARNRLVSYQYPSALALHGMLSPTPATAQRFGHGCAVGPSPGLLTDGRPRPDDPGFGLVATTLAANAPCVIALGFLAQGQHLGSGCVAWIAQPPAVLFLLADAAGRARCSVPIPADQSLRGISFVAQTAVLDPPRSLLSGLTFSDGLRVTIGD